MNVKDEIIDITACRGLFAAWVFIYHVDLQCQFAHFLGPAAGLVRRGYLGVDGFFLLSGMILMRVHPEFGVSVRGCGRFWIRRLGRIYPVHLAVIILLGVFVVTGTAMGMVPRDPTRFGLVPLVQNLLLVQGWGFGSPWSWNYPSWTISTEWAGYILFPFLALLIYRFYLVMVAGQIAIVCFPVLGLVAYASGHGLNVTGVSGTLVRFFPEFIMGMASARLVWFFADSMPTFGFAKVGFAAMLFGVLIGADFLVILGLWTLLFGLVMHADAERVPVFVKLPFLRAFGLLSYSFYMSFATAELLLTQGFRHAGWDATTHKLLFAVLMTALTFAIALVLNVLVETPCRRAVERWMPEPPAPPEVSRFGKIRVPGSQQGGAAR